MTFEDTSGATFIMLLFTWLVTMSVLSRHNVAHSPTNTLDNSTTLSPTECTLALGATSQQFTLLYKQVGLDVPLTPFSSPQSYPERNTVSTIKFT